jgi:hypothetical protein
MKVWELIQLLYNTALPDADVELTVSQRTWDGEKYVGHADFTGTKDMEVLKYYPTDVNVVTIEAFE